MRSPAAVANSLSTSVVDTLPGYVMGLEKAPIRHPVRQVRLCGDARPSGNLSQAHRGINHFPLLFGQCDAGVLQL